MGYVIVDEMHNNHPQMIQDMHWDKTVNLPYTPASIEYKTGAPTCSTDYFIIPVESEDSSSQSTDVEEPPLKQKVATLFIYKISSKCNFSVAVSIYQKIEKSAAFARLLKMSGKEKKVKVIKRKP